MTSSWFFLSTLNYDARSTTRQIYTTIALGGFTFTDERTKKFNQESGILRRIVTMYNTAHYTAG